MAYPIRIQRGFSLNEALISLTVLSAGLLALAQFEGDLHAGRRATKAQTTAVNLTQQKLEELRAQATADDGGITAGSDSPPVAAGDVTAFHRRWTVSTHRAPDYTEVAVITHWSATDGTPRSAAITTFITSGSPYTPGEGQPATVAITANTQSTVGGTPSVVTMSAQSSTCLCVGDSQLGRAILDPRSTPAACSNACCQTAWTSTAAAACTSGSCTFVALCGSP